MLKRRLLCCGFLNCDRLLSDNIQSRQRLGILPLESPGVGWIPVFARTVALRPDHAAWPLSLYSARVEVGCGQVVGVVRKRCGHGKHARYVEFHICEEAHRDVKEEPSS